MITCEKVHVVVTDEHGGRIERTIPAYTRPAKEMRQLIKEIGSEYIRLSEESGNGMSLGDFSLWMINKAACDPDTMEDR